MQRVLVVFMFLTVFFASVSLFIEPSHISVLKCQGGGPTYSVRGFWLNSTCPVKQFTLAEFVPDQSFVGYYNMRIVCHWWLYHHVPPCEVSFRNMWNITSPPVIKSTDPQELEAQAEVDSYSYSRPTIDDPDFTICLELKSDLVITVPVEGYFGMEVGDEGTTERPPDFTMPEHLTNCTCTSSLTLPSITSQSITSQSSTGTNPVSFLSIEIVLISVGVVLIWKKIIARKGERDAPNN